MGGGNSDDLREPAADTEKAHHAFDRHDTSFHKLNEATIASGTLAVRSAFILNGGATLALLAFAANTLTAEVLPPTREALVLQILSGLPWFAWGAFASAITTGIAFLSNRLAVWAVGIRTLHYASPHIRDAPSTPTLFKLAYALQILAIVATVISLVAFIVGLLAIASALPTDL